MIPGAFIKVIPQGGKLPDSPDEVHVSFDFPPPLDDYDCEGPPKKISEMSDGLLYLIPPPENMNPKIIITVKTPSGKSSDSLEFIASDYSKMVRNSKGYFSIAHEFRMDRAGTTRIGEVLPGEGSGEEGYLSCSIELNSGEDANALDLNSVSLVYINGVSLDQPVPAAGDPSLSFVQHRVFADTDSDGQPELLVKFPASLIQDQGSPASEGPDLATVRWVDTQGQTHEGTFPLPEGFLKPKVTLSPDTGKILPPPSPVCGFSGLVLFGMIWLSLVLMGGSSFPERKA